MKNTKSEFLLENNGHYWIKSKYDNSIAIGKYSKTPYDCFSLIGTGVFIHVDNFEVISNIILRETT